MEGERRYRVARSRHAAPSARPRQRLARHSGGRIPYHFRVLDLREVNAPSLSPAATSTSTGAVELALATARSAGSRRTRSRTLDIVLGGRGVGASLASLGARMVGDRVYLKYSRDAEREADR